MLVITPINTQVYVLAVMLSVWWWKQQRAETLHGGAHVFAY